MLERLKNDDDSVMLIVIVLQNLGIVLVEERLRIPVIAPGYKNETKA